MSNNQKTFHCPRWPMCGCPDGTVHPDCPGLAVNGKHIAEVHQTKTGEQQRDEAKRHRRRNWLAIFLGLKE